MSSGAADAIALFESDDPIPRDRLLGWMRDSDLRTRGAAFSLISEAWDRIVPSLTMDEASYLPSEYLLECLAANPEEEDHLMSGFQAAWALAAWLKDLTKHEGSDHIIRGVAHRLADMYREADEKTRNRIETGAVEHMFELPALRPYFTFWATDPVLKQAHEECLAWGVAHEGEQW